MYIKIRKFLKERTVKFVQTVARNYYFKFSQNLPINTLIQADYV